MQFSPWSLLLIVAIVLFVLEAFGVVLANVSLLPLGLAALAAAFLLGKGGSGLLR